MSYYGWNCSGIFSLLKNFFPNLKIIFFVLEIQTSKNIFLCYYWQEHPLDASIHKFVIQVNFKGHMTPALKITVTLTLLFCFLTQASQVSHTNMGGDLQDTFLCCFS